MGETTDEPDFMKRKRAECWDRCRRELDGSEWGHMNPSSAIDHMLREIAWLRKRLGDTNE